MATRKHTHEETFSVSHARLFALLHTPRAIRGWWGAARAIVLPQRGGIWAAAWGESEDNPDYITAATIREFDPPRRLVLADFRYHAKSGPPPFVADFVTEFAVEPHPEGALLRVDQDGFPPGPEADAFYAACGEGWTNTLVTIYLTHPADFGRVESWTRQPTPRRRFKRPSGTSRMPTPVSSS